MRHRGKPVASPAFPCASTSFGKNRLFCPRTPERSNRWIGKQLGVHHAIVASVRVELEDSGQIIHCERLVGADGREQASKGKYRPAVQAASKVRSEAERQARVAATTLMLGDCRNEMKRIATASVDCVITDPVYPEVDREYGRMTERDWHALMRDVVRECRRVLKPTGSALFILQPNYAKIGQMRLWLWEFILWAVKDWNLAQDVYWHTPDVMPLAGTERKNGLLRASVKWFVWLGPSNCYRNQENVLKPPSEPVAARVRPDELKAGPAGHTRRCGTMYRTAIERGGATPFNLLSIPKGGGSPGADGHPAVTPYAVADWWCRYLLPPGGVLLDPFCGSGSMLESALNNGASRVYGIDQVAKYLKTCRRRIAES